MSTMIALTEVDPVIAALRQAGNPFRNYFARNPDDESCARFHVPELFADEREKLLAIVDLYCSDPDMHCEVIPLLGNKGSGKTHLLHSIKHGSDGAARLLVTPGVYQRDTEFIEYLLYQTIETLLGGGQQGGQRPLDVVSDAVCRKVLARALPLLSPADKKQLFPAAGLGRWARALGFGGLSESERCNQLVKALETAGAERQPLRVKKVLKQAGLMPEQAFEIASIDIEENEPHSTSGLMRRAILQGFCKAALLDDENDLAMFLTNGFAELAFNVRPTRQELVLALFKAIMEVFRWLKIPVVVAFDQLEDLLLARRSDDGHKIAESFFAGLVQAMHQLDGLCFLVFAERGLWNRFVPSLDGYIRDRLNNPVHVPKFGTIDTLRLEAPATELVAQVVEARLRSVLTNIPIPEGYSSIFPFNYEQVARIARTESTLRDTLIQFRQLFDSIVQANDELTTPKSEDSDLDPLINRITASESDMYETEPVIDKSMEVKSVAIVEPNVAPECPRELMTNSSLAELWEQEQRMARRRLEPEGALAGATRELQSGLASLLEYCLEFGVKVGPWRLQHVVGDLSFGEHPTYGSLVLAHWGCKDAQPWKVGIGLFLARAGGKPKDLEVKLSAFDIEPAVVDHLILLRPDDDLTLSGKSKLMWNDSERRGRHSRIEAMDMNAFSLIAAFPRWLATIRDSLPPGQPLPMLTDVIYDKCDRILEQICMPIQ